MAGRWTDYLIYVGKVDRFKLIYVKDRIFDTGSLVSFAVVVVGVRLGGNMCKTFPTIYCI